MAIQIGPLTRPNGLTVSDNPGFSDPTWNWTPISGTGYQYTCPGFVGRMGEGVYEFPQKTLTFITTWTNGASYHVGSVVQYTSGTRHFYVCTNASGAGTNPPTHEQNNAHWRYLKDDAPPWFLVFGTISDNPEELMFLSFESVESGQAIGIQHHSNVKVPLLRVRCSVAGGIDQALPQFTWQEGNQTAVGFTEQTYHDEIALSQVDETTAPSALSCSGLRGSGQNISGLVLDNPTTASDLFDPYFGTMSLLALVDKQPLFAKKHLDAMCRCLYSVASGTIGDPNAANQWVGFPGIDANANYTSFPVRLECNAVFSVGNSVTVEKADAHDAAAGLFAALATRYAVANYDTSVDGQTGTAWMMANFGTVQAAIAKNIAERRRRIAPSLAFGTAMSAQGWISGANQNRNCGPVKTWVVGTTYSLYDLVWNPKLAPPLSNSVYCCKNATDAGLAANEPGVGATWTQKWNEIPYSDDAPPSQYLTETFQAWHAYPFLQFLDAVEAFVGYRAAYQLWTLRAWQADVLYLRLQVVSYQNRFFECIKEHEGDNKTTNPITGDDRAALWRELSKDHFPKPTLSEMGYTNISALATAASALYTICPPHGLLEGIRSMWKSNSVDGNMTDAVNWNSPAYDQSPGASAGAIVNNFENWYPQFLSFPYLVVFDVPLSESRIIDNMMKQIGMAYASNYAPFYWNSRNYDPFPNAVWTAAHAKLGIEAWALQGLDFAQRHYAPTHQLFIETQRPLMLNHHMMWYIAAKRWLADSTWRMV